MTWVTFGKKKLARELTVGEIFKMEDSSRKWTVITKNGDSVYAEDETGGFGVNWEGIVRVEMTHE